MVSRATSLALPGRGGGCLSRVRTYLTSTVVQGCWLFKVVSEPTSGTLRGSSAGCLSDVGTYIQGTVGQGCRLFKRFQNLPLGHGGAAVQAV